VCCPVGWFGGIGGGVIGIVVIIMVLSPWWQGEGSEAGMSDTLGSMVAGEWFL